MKRFVFIITTVFFLNPAVAQWKAKPVISISHGVSLFGSYYTLNKGLYPYSYSHLFHRTDVPYQSVSIKGGGSFVKFDYNLEIKLGYQYAEWKQSIGEYFKGMNIKREILKCHLLSFDIVNRFRELKIVRPFIQINIASEVATNFKYKYLKTLDYTPQKYFLSSTDPIDVFLNIYQSTPFIGNLSVGCDFRIYKGFSANVGIGYGLRIIRLQYARLIFPSGEQPSKPIYEDKRGNPYSLSLNYMTIQLGLSYAFDIHKKKPKTKEL